MAYALTLVMNADSGPQVLGGDYKTNLIVVAHDDGFYIGGENISTDPSRYGYPLKQDQEYSFVLMENLYVQTTSVTDVSVSFIAYKHP